MMGPLSGVFLEPAGDRRTSYATTVTPLVIKLSRRCARCLVRHLKIWRTWRSMSEASQVGGAGPGGL